MLILPSIDIKDGRCIHLYQGDFSQPIQIHEADPAQIAKYWQTLGARWLHVVDLDGAVLGKPVNIEVIARIRAATTAHIELGGGMRTFAAIKQMLEMGVDRIIIGTAAITDRPLLKEAVTQGRERIVVSLDARDNQLAIEGWKKSSSIQVISLVTELSVLGVQRFIFTDIARDNMLNGPNVADVREVAHILQKIRAMPVPIPLIVAGGISSLADIRALASLGIEGVIIGRALYTGAIDLAEAQQEVEE